MLVVVLREALSTHCPSYWLAQQAALMLALAIVTVKQLEHATAEVSWQRCSSEPHAE